MEHYPSFAGICAARIPPLGVGDLSQASVVCQNDMRTAWLPRLARAEFSRENDLTHCQYITYAVCSRYWHAACFPYGENCSRLPIVVVVCRRTRISQQEEEIRCGKTDGL